MAERACVVTGGGGPTATDLDRCPECNHLPGCHCDEDGGCQPCVIESLRHALVAERERAAEFEQRFNNQMIAGAELIAERDAAVQRADTLQRERDQWMSECLLVRPTVRQGRENYERLLLTDAAMLREIAAERDAAEARVSAAEAALTRIREIQQRLAEGKTVGVIRQTLADELAAVLDTKETNHD
jgi:hypothetical protein